MSYTPTMFLSILPEILILILGVLLLIVEPFWKGDDRRNAGWMTAGGLLAVMAVSLLAGRPGEPTTVFGGCFQNTILLTGLIQELESRNFEVFSHRQVPCNDGGVALGQALVAASIADAS